MHEIDLISKAVELESTSSLSSEDLDEVKSLGSPTESDIIRKMEGEIQIHENMIEDISNYMDYHTIFEGNSNNLVPYKDIKKKTDKTKFKLRRTNNRTNLDLYDLE
mmetsp:Transcript_6547/g.5628  ORF Transcript_6547/g.5628 Transcript_6547/m.5628 type:complete len:106 (+) Transcript_6547:651-968(+)